MYYLDFHQLYKPTIKSARIEIRTSLDRDKMMALRIKYQRGLCFYCATPIDMASHLDHLIPVYYGGSNRPSNLVGACKECNLFKETGQIEITNPNTLADYFKLQSAHRKWLKKYKAADARGKNRLKRYMPKRERLYRIYRADLLKSI